MDATRPSRTAMMTAILRGVHTRSSAQPILVDPWGERLVPDAVRAAIAQRAFAAAPPPAIPQADAASAPDAWLRRHASYANVITRSRYAEDRLHDAAARGVTQYLVLGAGFDTSWLRLAPDARLRVFEVDHPATQSCKLQRLAECGIEPAACVRYIAADLAQQPLADVLATCDFDPHAPTFVSWLGVTMYLTRQANMAALAGIRDCSAPGSELVFTYLDEVVWAAHAKAPSARFAQMQERLAAVGEPFLSGFDPATLAGELARAGFELVEDLSDTDLVRRYDPHGVHGFTVSGASRIARAVAR
jgi:methyltransferase (TIGR00027 family)